MIKNVSVIIPVFNEEKTVAHVVGVIGSLPFVHEVIIVDDASSDSTPDILNGLKGENIRVLTHPENSGKTAAIVTALENVTGEITAIQDADLEYDPRELEFLCDPIWEGKADVVYGSRFLIRRASRVLYFYHYLGNRFITFFSNIFTNKNMSDIETCYKVFRSFLLTSMPIDSSGFGFEVEVTAKVSKTRARMYEAPISYHGRTYEQGKKISYVDGLSALWYILRYNLAPGAATRSYVDESNRKLGELWN
jgi:glycosyltransferase involved in cell wall biosynthesis